MQTAWTAWLRARRRPTGWFPPGRTRRWGFARAASRLREDRRGTTAVEFGFVALPLFAVIAAIFEVGYCDYQSEIVVCFQAVHSKHRLTRNLYAYH